MVEAAVLMDKDGRESNFTPKAVLFAVGDQSQRRA